MRELKQIDFTKLTGLTWLEGFPAWVMYSYTLDKVLVLDHQSWVVATRKNDGWYYEYYAVYAPSNREASEKHLTEMQLCTSKVESFIQQELAIIRAERHW